MVDFRKKNSGIFKGEKGGEVRIIQSVNSNV